MEHLKHCLECRVCSSVESLDLCTDTKQCKSNEACYMEEIITASGKIEYIGGCRSNDLCGLTLSGGRKRQADGSLIACSRCCDTPEVTNATDSMGKELCNDLLCGLRRQFGTHECYSCNDITDNDVNSCNHITSCGPDEVCGADAFNNNGHVTYSMGCRPKESCLFVTKVLVETHPQGIIGKRSSSSTRSSKSSRSASSRSATNKRSSVSERSSTKVCNVCCGDQLCNTGLCVPLLNKLIRLNNAHKLDIDTMTYIRT
ncbi:hypothetical protein ACF0H5_022140 [Mactra antiquata]